MNSQMQSKAQLKTTTYAEIPVSEKDMLTGWGFSTEEITALLWLRQWYQRGGSDRASVIRHLEFLKLLVRSGELEL